MRKELSDQLFNTVDLGISRLKELNTDEFNSGRPQGKWAAQEIIGHLIDSAANNRQRFVILQYDQEQSFIRYNQDKWVELQDYRNSDWEFLIDLWAKYNRLIAKIISLIDDRNMSSPVKGGNSLTFRITEEEIEFAYLIEDYIIHLKHHLGQLIDI